MFGSKVNSYSVVLTAHVSDFLSTKIFCLSTMNKNNTFYPEITFEQKIIYKKKFIVVKAKKMLENYILIINISLLVMYQENNCKK